MSVFRRLLNSIGEPALIRFTLGVLIFALVFIYYSPNIIYNVPAGYVGVRWSRFFGGTVLNQIYEEGIHFILPWDKLYVYDARVTHEHNTYDALTIDGLHIALTVDVRYRLISENIPYLHKNVGENYVSVLLEPTVGAFLRTNIARFTAEEVYSTQRLFIEQSVLQQIRSRFRVNIVADLPQAHFIDYDQVQITTIRLPDRVQAAIESKIEQYHVALEWRFRLDREELESQRRLVEARATSEISDLLRGKLDDAFLRRESINALVQLATAPGSRTVILGQGGGILPLLPGTDQLAVGTTGASLQPTSSLPPLPSSPPPIAPPAPARPPGPRRRRSGKTRPWRTDCRP